jgi:hypothetical protein
VKKPGPAPLCCDCRHMETGWMYMEGPSKAFCVRDREMVPDPVYGRDELRLSRPCLDERAAPRRCGPRGRWFEPREPGALTRLIVSILSIFAPRGLKKF